MSNKINLTNEKFFYVSKKRYQYHRPNYPYRIAVERIKGGNLIIHHQKKITEPSPREKEVRIERKTTPSIVITKKDLNKIFDNLGE